MKTSEIAQMIASFLDGQDIVEPLEGELLAVSGDNGQLIISVYDRPNHCNSYLVTVERLEQ